MQIQVIGLTSLPGAADATQSFELGNAESILDVLVVMDVVADIEEVAEKTEDVDVWEVGEVVETAKVEISVEVVSAVAIALHVVVGLVRLAVDGTDVKIDVDVEI